MKPKFHTKQPTCCCPKTLYHMPFLFSPKVQTSKVKKKFGTGLLIRLLESNELVIRSIKGCPPCELSQG